MNILKLTSQERKIIFIASLGGALEFYDFVIFVIFAPIIGQLFFPETDKLASLMSVYAVFAIGYLVRPLGGIVFSHFGDTRGRKTTFALSVMMMAVPTFVIGLLPTYEQIGIFSTIMLVALRVFQGLSVGGELPGALTFTCEHVQQNRRGIALGILSAGLGSGVLLASFMNLILNTVFSSSQFALFGWRIAFLFGGLLGVMSFYIRKQIAESPEFVKIKNVTTVARIPFFEAFNLHGIKIVQGIGMTLLPSVAFYLLFVNLPNYLSTTLSYSEQYATVLNTINLILFLGLTLVFCWCGDKFKIRLNLMIFGAIGLMLFGYFLFAALSYQTTWALLSTLVLIAIFNSAMAVSFVILTELFPTSVRYTGVAICYNITIAFGGLTPLISTFLVKYFGSPLAPSYYLVFCALFCVISCVGIRRKAIEFST